MIVSILLGVGLGAYSISPDAIFNNIVYALGGNVEVDTVAYNVFWYIRMPRVIFGLLIGATLAVAGVGFQGLFRNPLADAGLIGVDAGASLAAIFTIVLGSTFFLNFQSFFGRYLLNVMAFVGAICSTLLVSRMSKSQGKTHVVIMLLAGIAINAIVRSVSGLITLAASDEELRTITFWNLGSLGGATWNNVLVLLPFVLITIVVMPYMSKPLNALALGEQDAAAMGIEIERVKKIIMIVCAIGVGACVAMSGMIGFIGLVVPHIFRLFIGPEHKKLILMSILGGGILLILSDLLSRTMLAPIEIPIGVITSLIGGPFFIYLILREKRKNFL